MNNGLDDPMNLIEAQQLKLSRGGVPLWHDLSFSVGPGLTFVRGGEGRGKSSLLQVMAGTMEPDSGTVRRLARTTFHESPADPVHDAGVASDWLAARQASLPGWDAGVATGLIEGFGLAEHIHKPMYMLSTGSRRKVGLVAAAASGAELTLIDTPFAALDTPSCRVLTQLLREAAQGDRRAWVMADYELPASLAGARLAGLIDLGDWP
ncbi:ATP-binding cassette domain-containing protein [Variovorax sp. YR752]|uniref:ABC transporter ATP-binding protein n=1 Tax=Variovorax sp. YR752 TaxID=1884383 RepID=UPI003137DA3C